MADRQRPDGQGALKDEGRRAMGAGWKTSRITERCLSADIAFSSESLARIWSGMRLGRVRKTRQKQATRAAVLIQSGPK